MSSVVPQAPNGTPAAIDFPALTKSGSRPHSRGEAARTEHLRMGLVVGEQRAGRPCQLAHPGVEALVRQHQPVVVRHRGLGHHDRDVAAIQRRLERARSLKGTSTTCSVTSAGRPCSSGTRRPSRRARRAPWSKCPWYLPSNISTLSRPVDHARDPDHLGVGLRRRQRVLPLGEAVAARQLLGHARSRPRSATGTGCRAPSASLTARTTGLGRVAAEHGHVGDVEVAVREPVDVGEPRTLSRVHPQRQVVVGAAEPGHRHAVGHRVPGARPQLGRPRASRVEPLVLGVLELLDQVAVDRRGEHGGQSRRGGQGQNRTADTAVFSRVLYQLSYLAGWRRSVTGHNPWPPASRV